MKTFRGRVKQRKEGPALSSGIHSNLQRPKMPGKGGRASEGESGGVASKVRGNQKRVVLWKQKGECFHDHHN